MATNRRAKFAPHPLTSLSKVTLADMAWQLANGPETGTLVDVLGPNTIKSYRRLRESAINARAPRREVAVLERAIEELERAGFGIERQLDP